MRRICGIVLAVALVLAPMGAASASESAYASATATAFDTGSTDGAIIRAAQPQVPEIEPLPGFDIRILSGSTIHLVSRSSKLPISIQNNYPVEIRVQVHVAANSLNALFPSVVEVTVPADTTYVAQVPVTAIADGDVGLKAWLTTFSGLSLGDPVDLNLTVNAEVEESLIGVFMVVVAGLLVAGVIRTIRKRRRAL